jgi:hypothetical protein
VIDVLADGAFADGDGPVDDSDGDLVLDDDPDGGGGGGGPSTEDTGTKDSGRTKDDSGASVDAVWDVVGGGEKFLTGDGINVVKGESTDDTTNVVDRGGLDEPGCVVLGPRRRAGVVDGEGPDGPGVVTGGPGVVDGKDETGAVDVVVLVGRVLVVLYGAGPAVGGADANAVEDEGGVKSGSRDSPGDGGLTDVAAGVVDGALYRPTARKASKTCRAWTESCCEPVAAPITRPLISVDRPLKELQFCLEGTPGDGLVLLL